MLNSILTFLFINSKANARLIEYKSRASSESFSSKKDDKNFYNFAQLVKTKFIYDKAIRSYFLGLGFLLSFVPGTEPFKARMALHDLLLVKRSTIFYKTGILEFLNPLKTSYNALDGKITFSERIENTINGNYTNLHLHPFNFFQYLVSPIMAGLEWLKKPQIGYHIVGVSLALVGAIILLILMPILEVVLRIVDCILFDPIRFIVEEILDLPTKPFIYMSKKEFELLDTLDKQLVPVLKKPSTTYGSQKKFQERQHLFEDQYALAIFNEKKMKRFNKYTDSFFFKNHQATGLVNVPQNTAQLVFQYNLLSNLNHLFLFSIKTQFLPELVGYIAAICDRLVGEENERLKYILRGVDSEEDYFEYLI